MNKPGFWVALAGLIFVSAFLGFRLYHFQQDGLARSSPEQPGNAIQPHYGLPDPGSAQAGIHAA